MDAIAEDDVGIPEPTKEQSGIIKAIAKDTVHQICSGQVVLSLAVAVKELVENAIDAGATLIEVKLRNQGLESLEVSDNGSGVEECNILGMTAKYHTSKIREFIDLQGVETFGFRGEALSSLCALSDMTIVTRHCVTDVGLKIELDHEGNIKKRTPCARSVGTTVTLAHLFGTLPVRKRDFTRNIKKEFTKMCQILQAYCLVTTGVRIICSNQSPKGSKSVIMQTHGSQDVLANISAIFGNRQTTEIVALKSPFSADSEGGTLTEQSLIAEMHQCDDSMQITSEDVDRLNAQQFQLDGYISSCSHGSGRSSKDRQYFYVNSRPCEPKNIAKVINEVYHRYNVQQVPFIYLNVITARSEVDVNLTPDKRQLLINNEKILLLAIKKSLLNTFGKILSTYKVQNSTILSMLHVEAKNDVNEHKNKQLTEETEEETGDDILPTSSTQRFADVLSQWKHTGDTVGIAPHLPVKRKCTEEIAVRTLKLQKIQNFLTQEKQVAVKEPNVDVGYKSESDEENDIQTPSLNESLISEHKLNKASAEYDALTLNTSPNLQKQTTLNFQKSTQSKTVVELDDSASDSECTVSCTEINTTIAEIELSITAEENLINANRTKAKLERLRFKSEINPSQNQNAEAELQKEISKEAFARMDILGQFNLGFIIVKLDTDLFIVDQHATDEKYNFEILQRTTVLQNQTLAVPQTLEMTAVNEMVLLDHLTLFEKNGFKFEINDNAPPTKKVRLLGKPFSKNWEFGKEDIDELIFMLQDAPDGTVCRPSRIRAMFASRACRKSVMIGKALTKASMKTLITHMGEIEQPWNCPHGRPTMRHLINIAMLVDEEEEAAECAKTN